MRSKTKFQFCTRYYHNAIYAQYNGKSYFLNTLDNKIERSSTDVMLDIEKFPVTSLQDCAKQLGYDLIKIDWKTMTWAGYQKVTK